MKALTALLVAGACIQGAEAIQFKSQTFKELAQTARFSDSQWLPVHPSWVSVAIADDSTIIATNSQDDVFLRNASDGQWSQLPGKMKQVSIGSVWNIRRILGVDAAGQVSELSFNSWRPLPQITVQSASVDNQGAAIFVRDKANGVYLFQGGPDPWIKQSVACKYVYTGSRLNTGCINSDGQVLRRVSTQDVWTTTQRPSPQFAPPAFEKLAVSSNGRGVALTANGQLYFKADWISTADEWVQIPGKTWANVGISRTHIVGTTTAGEMFWLDHTKRAPQA